MADQGSFLDNLANLRIVMSVALEHIQTNREQFAKSGAGEHVRQAERVISKIRSLADELENEFKVLESLLAQQRRLM